MKDKKDGEKERAGSGRCSVCCLWRITKMSLILSCKASVPAENKNLESEARVNNT